MMRTWIWGGLLGLASAAAVAGVWVWGAGNSPPAVNDQKFHETLQEIARFYEYFQPVDFESRISPLDCRAPVKGIDYTPAVARFSASKDDATHGRKLYFLFAKDRIAYRALSPGARKQPIMDIETVIWSDDKAPKLKNLSQIVVKQSWLPEEPGTKLEKRQPERFGFGTSASRDGKEYRIGERADLYIMYKVAPGTADTDNGWVYGTVTADGKTVTSAGRVASCMNCHKDAKHDRLFGLAKSK